MHEMDYIRPPDLTGALDFLAAHGPDTTILAGGTDVMVDLRSGQLPSRYLLDISRLPELRRIEACHGELTVGAAVTIAEIYASETIGRLAPALQKAAATFASRPVRNVATIGGNVAHCSPCGDTIPPLLIHDARAEVFSPRGRRRVAVEQMADGPYHCTLRPDEVITAFVLKCKPDEAGFVNFQKIGRRKALAIARISMAVMAQQQPDKTIGFIRFALGSCTPTPHRFQEIEEFLLGKVPDEPLLWQAGRLLADRMLAVTGRRPSAQYKEPAIQGLFVRLMVPLV